MVLRGAQIHRCGQAKCSLFSTQSLPHDLARLYGRMLPLTPADLGGAADPCLDALRIWTDSHGQKSFSAPRSRRRNARLPHNQLPDAEGTFYVPGHCLIVLMLFTWIVAMWTSCGESEEHQDMEKPERSFEEQDHREAALKQDVDRTTASSQLPQKRSCIMCEKTRSHTYVFRSPDGGPYGL